MQQLTISRRGEGRGSLLGPVVLLAVAGLLALAGCSDSSPTTPGGSTTGARYPAVEAVEITDEGDGTYTLDVTISSPYDTPERYADGWRVLDEAGNELGAMTLGHDHAGEQPFTRSQTGLEIPDGVSAVTVQGHDLVNGYGGATVTVDVPAG